MLQGFKVRLIPTRAQKELFWKSVGAARFAWNWGLAHQMERFAKGEKLLRDYDLRSVFKEARKREENSWLNDVSANGTILAVFDLGTAYKNFFRIQKLHKQGEKFSKETIAKAKRQGRKLTPYDMKGHPKFKKRDLSKPSFPVVGTNLYFKEDRVNLEKIGKVKFQAKQDFPQGRKATKFYNPRVSWTGRVWVLSFAVEVPDLQVQLNDFSCGIDVGVKNLAVVSCNDEMFVVKNINKTKRVRRLKKQLQHAQRELSRKQKGSKNKRKARQRVRKIYSKISNIRHDYTHKTTTEIVSMLPARIVIEDLNISGMMKNRHLSKAISEQNWYKFRQQLEYKTTRRGIELVLADRFYPSSKLCSVCGCKNNNLKLSDRVFKCVTCGIEIDRDMNAARNLEKYIA